MRKPLALDMKVGGFGDVWMRLAGLYSLSALRQDLSVTCAVHPALLTLANAAFGDRITLSDTAPEQAYTFTVRGIRHLLPGLLKGKRYLAPYHRVTYLDGVKHDAKARLNVFLHNLLDALGRVGVPPWETTGQFQGFMELSCIKELRRTSYEAFLSQSQTDYDAIRTRIKSFVAESPDSPLDLSGDLSLSIFPGGTAHQFMPSTWAKQFAPKAVFWFHDHDRDAIPLIETGLEVRRFSRPEDIALVALRSKQVLTTDSFPSHVLQFTPADVSVLLTIQPKERIVHPCFKGPIIDSAVPCSPCRHIARGEDKRCQLGYEECLTWTNEKYSQRVSELLMRSGTDALPAGMERP